MGYGAEQLVREVEDILDTDDSAEEKIKKMLMLWFDENTLLGAASLEEIMREFDRRGLLYHVTFSAKAVVDEK